MSSRCTLVLVPNVLPTVALFVPFPFEIFYFFFASSTMSGSISNYVALDLVSSDFSFLTKLLINLAELWRLLGVPLSSATVSVIK